MNLALSEVGVASDYQLRETVVGDKQACSVATCHLDAHQRGALPHFG